METGTLSREDSLGHRSGTRSEEDHAVALGTEVVDTDALEDVLDDLGIALLVGVLLHPLAAL